jgi:hypothetical protein
VAPFLCFLVLLHDIGLNNFTALLRLAIFESVTNSLESTGSKSQKFRAFTMFVAVYWVLQERLCAFACKGVCESIEMKCEMLSKVAF